MRLGCVQTLPGVCALALAVGPSVLLAQQVNVECPNQCYGHGLCTPNVVYGVFECSCANGYHGFDCSRRSCPLGNAWVDVATATDTAHALSECSNRGMCDASTGECECQVGFEGMACERMACPSRTATVCSGHGKCLSMAEMGAFRDDVAAFSTFSYTTHWDADKVHGCACERGWSGYDCSVRTCAFGDDPVTTGQDDEVQEVTCTCDGTCAGGLAFSFRGEVTEVVAYNANAATVEAALEQLSTVGDISVSLTGSLCDDGSNALSVTFLTEPGDVPPLRWAYSSLTSSSADPTVDVVEVTKGTRENVECNNRGRCNRVSGFCECDEGYKSSDGAGAKGTRGDCGLLNTTTVACPSVLLRTQVGAGDGEIDGYGFEEVPCGRFGVCGSNSTCRCFDGWTGYDCTKRQCPLGLAWFDEASTADETAHLEVECSNRGICNSKSGACECQTGFEGAACQRMACPVGRGGATCSSAGTCESMRVHATRHTDEAGNPDPVQYGAIFHGAATWDADRVRGCLCTSDDVFGYDCSLRRCATGAPPGTASSSLNEVQTLACSSADAAAATAVELTFRGRTTASLTGDSDAAAVEVALEALGAGDVDVAIAGSGTLCDSGDHVSVTFLEQFGTVAVLSIASSTSIVTVEVNQTQASTQLDLECAALGMCDYDTGICQCFDGYTSSDGKARMGSLGDCGFDDGTN